MSFLFFSFSQISENVQFSLNVESIYMKTNSTFKEYLVFSPKIRVWKKKEIQYFRIDTFFFYSTKKVVFTQNLKVNGTVVPPES